MRRPARVPAIALAVGLVLTAMGAAVAQESPPLPDPLVPVPRDEVTGSFPIDDGTYTGTVGLGGSFWFSGEGVTVVWKGSSSGPLQFSVIDGKLSGTWSVEGTADITGYGFPFEMAGVNTWSMSGTVTGKNPYTMEGSGSGVSIVSAAGQTAHTDYVIPVASAPWQGVMQVCGQVVGNWDQAIDAAMEEVPLQHSLRSYFTVFSTDFTTELDTRTQELVQEATRLPQDLSKGAIPISESLNGLLGRAEELMGQIEAQPDGCPADPSFMRMITQVVQDVMNTFLNHWGQETPDFSQMTSLRRMVEVGLRAGALGAGEPESGAGSLLKAKADQVLQSQYDAVVGQEPNSDRELREMAVTAALLGYTFDKGVGATEICLVPQC